MNRIEHLLSCLAQKCTVITNQALDAKRFGLQEKDNCQLLRDEIIDLFAVIRMLREEANLPWKPVYEVEIEAKIKKVNQFMEYAERQGTLDKGVSNERKT